jgi:hypothetical protein
MINCENLHIQILNFYGEDCLKEIGIFENLGIKIMKIVVDLTFLKWFHDSFILPPFTRIHQHHRHHWRPNLNRIFTRADNAILYAKIHYSRSSLFHLSCKVLKLYLKLSLTICFYLWSIIDHRSYNAAFNFFESTSSK